MFLISTADPHFWRRDARPLFLGEWCRVHTRKPLWADLDGELLPYHWDDRARLACDVRYLDGLHERALDSLAQALNTLHGRDHAQRYWRFVVGPWLAYFLGVAYDRYLSIQTASQSGRVTGTLVPPLVPGQWTAADFNEFQDEMMVEDTYNQHLYGYFIRSSGLPYEEAPGGEKSGKAGVPPPRRYESVKRWIDRSMRTWMRGLPPPLRRFVFVSSYLGPEDQVKLQLSLGQAPLVLRNTVLRPRATYDAGRRARLSDAWRAKFSPADGGFEAQLMRLLPEQVPLAYVEGFEALERLAASSLPQGPKVILTAVAFISDELFKVWAAGQTERGAKLVVLQQGGHLGTGAWCTLENHQRRICDRFFSWGWDDPGDGKVVPLPSGKLAALRSGLRRSPRGPVLLVSNAFPRYSYRLFSVPVAAQALAFLEDQMQLVRSVPDRVRQALEVRLYHIDYGWNERERWRDFDPTLRLHHRGKPLLAQLAECRLAIHAQNTTTFLETLAAGYPTLLFWNPRHWELREAAAPYFDGLKAAGIFHETPESAARKVAEIFDDVGGWWESRGVREARERFCNRFARTSDDWRFVWKRELERLVT